MKCFQSSMKKWALLLQNINDKMTYYNKMLTTIDHWDDSYIIDMRIIDRHIPFKNNNLNTTHNSSFPKLYNIN